MSAKAERRARQFADGVSTGEIARQDGVTYGAVRESISSFIMAAGRRASPGSQLPDGMYWRTISHGPWAGTQIPASDDSGIRPEYARWAVAVMKQDVEADPCCPTCGRPI